MGIELVMSEKKEARIHPYPVADNFKITWIQGYERSCGVKFVT